MKLPYLNNIKMKRSQIGSFAGLDKRIITQDNAFADMENITADFFPAAAVRNNRGTVIKILTKPNGIFWKNGLAYVDGTDFIYEGEKKGEVADSNKNMVGMGAYILIFPDKKYFNTSSKEFGNLEKEWIQASQAKFEPTYEASVYTKITCTGIGKNFGEKDGVEISGCSNAGFNGTFIIEGKTDDSITVISTLDKAFTQDSGLKITKKIPDMDFLVENENRLWGCSNKKHEIYASKLGDPTNFHVFEQLSTDSYAATVGSDGDFTGAASCQGNVIFFKENMIHKVQGNKPSNIQFTSQEAAGVKKGCEKTLCTINGTLYYRSPQGVYAYNGGIPYLISEMLGNDIGGTAAGKYKDKYYLFAPKTLVYSTQYKIWNQEDELDAMFCTSGDGKLYLINIKNELSEVEGTKEEKIHWFLESGDQEEGTLQKKTIQKLQVLLELERGTRVDISFKYDSEPVWRHACSVAAKEKKTTTIFLKPRRCSHYRYRIEGLGKAKLLGIGKYIREGRGA